MRRRPCRHGARIPLRSALTTPAVALACAAAASSSAGFSADSPSGLPKRTPPFVRAVKRTRPCQSPRKLDHHLRPVWPRSHIDAAIAWVRRRSREATLSALNPKRSSTSGWRRWPAPTPSRAPSAPGPAPGDVRPAPGGAGALGGCAKAGWPPQSRVQAIRPRRARACAPDNGAISIATTGPPAPDPPRGALRCGPTRELGRRRLRVCRRRLLPCRGR